MSRARHDLLAAAMTLACACGGVFAQGMVDPTRPPPGVLSGEFAEEAVRGPVLQSIIIRAGRRAAIISGQRVELGGRYGDARVAAIRETEVVLRSRSGTEVLKLYPDVHMKMARDAARQARKPRPARN